MLGIQQLEKDLISSIAEWCIEVSASESTNGSYYIYLDNIIEKFCAIKEINENAKEWLYEKAEDIADYIDKSDKTIDITDFEIDDNGNLEAFGLWISGEVICEKCGCQKSSNCKGCEVSHPREWDMEDKTIYDYSYFKKFTLPSFFSDNYVTRHMDW